MDNRPIGFFDSGLGGLTCIPFLRKKLPNEKIIYFGDTARTPYGSKAPETILNFSIEIADFLVDQNVKIIVIACNTVSAIALETLRERHPNIPILGIIQPGAEKVARLCSEENSVGIMGTKATIKSHVYENVISQLNSEIPVYSVASPALVPLIEEGIIESDIMDLTLKYYLEDFVLENRIDTLVLGCTHYPLISKNIERLLPDLRIINPSEEIASSIYETLKKENIFAEEVIGPEAHKFYASDLSENFLNMIDIIFEGKGKSQELAQFKTLDEKTITGGKQ